MRTYDHNEHIKVNELIPFQVPVNAFNLNYTLAQKSSQLFFQKKKF